MPIIFVMIVIAVVIIIAIYTEKNKDKSDDNETIFYYSAKQRIEKERFFGDGYSLVNGKPFTDTRKAGDRLDHDLLYNDSRIVYQGSEFELNFPEAKRKYIELNY